MKHLKPDEIKERLEGIHKRPHCADCGTIEPSVISYGGGSRDGFTECCNEKICDGTHNYLFGNDRVSVRACCWAAAELKFKLQGVNLSKHHGMSRLLDNEME